MQIPFEIDYNYVLGLAQQLPQSEQAQLFQDLKINDNELFPDVKANDSLDSFFTPQELSKLQEVCKETDGKLAIFVPNMSYFSPEEQEEMRRNRETIEASLPKRTEAEWQKIIEHSLNCPVATDEEIQMQNETRMEFNRRWL